MSFENEKLSRREKLVADMFFANMDQEVSIDDLRKHVANKEGKDVEEITRRSMNGTIKTLAFKLSGSYAIERVSGIGAGVIGQYVMSKIKPKAVERKRTWRDRFK